MATARAAILFGQTRASERWPLCRTPPQLVEVVNRPLLAHQLDALLRSGIEEVAIVARPSARPAIREVVESRSGTELGVTYITERPRSRGLQALLAAESFAADSVLAVQWGAGLVEHDLRQSMRSLVSRGLDVLAIGAPVDVARPARVIQLRAGGPALSTREPLDISDVDMLVVGPGLWGAIRGLAAERGSAEPGVELLGRLAESGARVDSERVTRWRTRIEDMEARVETSVLRGPVVIGAGAYVSDSYIGPYTSIGPDAYVESVEMEHCVVMRGATVERVGTRLEGCVIGAGARVTQDIGPPRALRAWVGEDADISLG
jgi:glucose-1-phosphate thymidylyltransferase